MQDETVTTECLHGRVDLVGSLPTRRHLELGTSVHALQSFDLYVQSRPRSWTNHEDMFVPHVSRFLRPTVVESVVSCGCSRLEESGSLYLVDPIAIIEVRGEEVLTSSVYRGKLWRRVPGVPGVPKL
jgi:hypothetical protein